MLKSRRFRTFVLLFGILGLLFGSFGTQVAQAQVPDVNVTGVVTGRTDPDPDPQGHTLGVNRVQGPSKFQDDFLILATVTCGTDVGVVALSSPDAVTFDSDDDLTDGHGTIDGGAVFSGTDVVGGGTVRVEIEGGEFHRLLGVVEVDLDVEVDFGSCDESVELRLVLHLLPDAQGIVAQPSTPLSGFLLAGVASRHGYVNGDRTSAARTACDNAVADSIPRVQDPHHTVSSSIPPGRDDFHPCA